MRLNPASRARLWESAIHEAGHAVYVMAVGGRVRFAEIRPIGGGLVVCDLPVNLHESVRLGRILAGDMAATLTQGQKPPSGSTCWPSRRRRDSVTRIKRRDLLPEIPSDEELLAVELPTLPEAVGDALLDHAGEVARLVLETHRPALLRLATALFHRGLLTAKECTETFTNRPKVLLRDKPVR
ncbi:MAG: hypothetical protein JJU36_07895 [Phycisphaeraceae bacterium]|nr:hypothetical protein [Phycisphaeraceae bacterium]